MLLPDAGWCDIVPRASAEQPASDFFYLLIHLQHRLQQGAL
jgi:hypothetical protein